MGMHHQGKRMYAAMLVTIVVGIAMLAAVAAPPALAGHPDSDSYKHGTAQSCTSCHSSPSGPSGVPTNALCTTCHTNFVAVESNNCWTCHTPGQDMSTFKTAGGCATNVAGAACHNTAVKHVGATLNGGCTSCHSVTTSATNPSNSSHHVVGYTIKPALSLRLSATRITRGKTVTAKGIMHRNVTGGVVTIKVQKKNSSGVWKPLLKKLRPSTLAEKYSWKYKPLKKGSYRMQSSVPAADNGKILRGKTAWKTFKVR